MSPDNQGVFQLKKEVTFRRPLTFYCSRKWGHAFLTYVTIFRRASASFSLRKLRVDTLNATAIYVVNAGVVHKADDNSRGAALAHHVCLHLPTRRGASPGCDLRAGW